MPCPCQCLPVGFVGIGYLAQAASRTDEMAVFAMVVLVMVVLATAAPS